MSGLFSCCFRPRSKVTPEVYVADDDNKQHNTAAAASHATPTSLAAVVEQSSVLLDQWQQETCRRGDQDDMLSRYDTLALNKMHHALTRCVMQYSEHQGQYS